MFDRYSERALQVIFLSRWAAGSRGADSIELDDLLEALVREDRGDFSAANASMLPSRPGIMNQGSHTPFFSSDEAGRMLEALKVAPREAPKHTGIDMPVSELLGTALESAVKIADRIGHKTIEPLHLLAAIVEDRDSYLAQLLGGCSITRQRVAQALKLAG